MILLLGSCRSAGFIPWLFLWRSWQHPPYSQTQTVSEAGCGPASPSACSPPLWQLLSHNKTKPRREFNSCGRSNESVEDTEKHIEEGDLMVVLTAGDHPADLGAGNLEEDAEGCDPGIGVQHSVQSPHQETCEATWHRIRWEHILETDLKQQWSFYWCPNSSWGIHCL